MAEVTEKTKGDAGKPIVLFYNDFFGLPLKDEWFGGYDGCVFTTDRRQFSRASAVVFHVPTLQKFSRLRKRKGQLWVAWSLESDVNYPRLLDPAFMSHIDLTMTYARSADIWWPYVPHAHEFEALLAQPIPAKTADAPVVMFQSDPIDRSGRNALARDLMEHIGVHSYGRFANNKTLPGDDRSQEKKRAAIASYKFCIGFENSIATDYVTEKFFGPLLAGTVPVYLGAPNVDLFAPGEHAFINASHFSSPRELAEYLKHLDSDDEAYRQYFEWRKKGLSEPFKQLLSDVSSVPFRRLGEIVAARPALPPPRWKWPWQP